MRRLRIITQCFSFALFTFSFFFLTLQKNADGLFAPWFIRLNPLTGLLTLIASHKIIASVFVSASIVLVATIVWGRVFCGYICPLGALVDFADRYLFDKMRSPQRRPPLFLQRGKYIVLIALLIIAVFGSTVALFTDPISLLTRFFTLLAYPVVRFFENESIKTMAPVLAWIGADAVLYKTFMVPFFYGAMFSAVLAAAVLGGGFWDKRFWCQYICPSGAFFGIVGRFTFFRRFTHEKICRSCLLCARKCPTRAIDEKKTNRTNASECILCGICVGIKDDCSGFRFGKTAAGPHPTPDLHRRHLLAGIAGGVLFLPGIKFSSMKKRDETGRLIRPPGSVLEEEFLGRCIACGECMKSCPTNGLQPCGINDGIHRLFTPKLVPRIGWCDEKCALCGHVCPTGAIRNLTSGDKPFIKIGTAVIDRHRCVAWEQNKNCIVCDEVCPYNAIEGKMMETPKGLFKVPILYEDLCTGCGICENHCPISDMAAIMVYKFGENRKSKGPYASESEKQAITNRRSVSDSDGAFEGDAPSDQKDTAQRLSSPKEPGHDAGTTRKGTALPPGFTE
jgi:MauM/NapG family ferredoxin protein